MTRLRLRIGLAGPGRVSVDHLAGLIDYTKAGYVLIAAVAAVAGAAPLVARVVRTRQRGVLVLEGLAAP